MGVELEELLDAQVGRIRPVLPWVDGVGMELPVVLVGLVASILVGLLASGVSYLSAGTRTISGTLRIGGAGGMSPGHTHRVREGVLVAQLRISRLSSLLIAFLALMALVLAVVGILGVLSILVLAVGALLAGTLPALRAASANPADLIQGREP